MGGLRIQSVQPRMQNEIEEPVLEEFKGFERLEGDGKGEIEVGLSGQAGACDIPHVLKKTSG